MSSADRVPAGRGAAEDAAVDAYEAHDTKTLLDDGQWECECGEVVPSLAAGRSHLAEAVVDAVLAVLASDTGTRQQLVVFDVDGTVACGQAAPDVCPRPGMRDTLDLLTYLGYEVHFWSAGGAEHARTVAESCGFHGAVRGYHDKPDYPITEKAAEAELGRVPALTVDDDASERVGAWPFFELEGWSEHPRPSPRDTEDEPS